MIATLYLQVGVDMDLNFNDEKPLFIKKISKFFVAVSVCGGAVIAFNFVLKLFNF